MPALSLPTQAAALIAEQLPRGIFLTVGGETPNVMTIGWGGLAYYWRKHIFVAPVRPQRFTYPLLKAARTFAVCVPSPGDMREEIEKAGVLSGRDGDKFKAISLETKEARSISAPIIKGSALVLECRVLAENDFMPGRTDQDIVDLAYGAGDFHTLFYGEILACYTGDPS